MGSSWEAPTRAGPGALKRDSRGGLRPTVQGHPRCGGPVPCWRADSCPGRQRLTWHRILSPWRLLGKRVSSETSITQEGSRHLPQWTDTALGWARGSGAAAHPAQQVPISLPVQPFIAAAGERAERAGRLAGSRLGSCLLLPPPSGSDIIPLSQGGAGARILGSREKDGEHRATRWGGWGARD